jgi:hypothetical protein
VDAGIHRVEFRFMPRSFVYGAIGSLAGVLILAGGVAFMLRPGAGDPS